MSDGRASFAGRGDAHVRLDLQGLRAVAVALVVAYHAGGLVPSGYLGVDVFFALSGYVIAGAIVREHDHMGAVALGAFYARRVKRLLPALALVVLVTTALSALVLSPLGPQQATGETGVGAMLLLANLAVARTTGGYFDAPADQNPLLHVWSLSVEEQLYLVTPALLALALRRGRRTALVGATGLAGLSLALTLVGSDPSGTGPLGFYSPVTRAWEFLAGAAVALSTLSVRPALAGALRAGALATLLVATGLPGPTGPSGAVWAVGATLCLLVAGREAAPGLLGAAPLAAVGDRSYAIYLWHWPALVIARQVAPQWAWTTPVAVLATFGLAYASYAAVERPVRAAPMPTGRRRVALATALFAPPLVASLALWATAEWYWGPRYNVADVPVAYPGDLGEQPILQAVSDRYPACTPATLRAHAPEWSGIVRCQQSRPEAPVVAIVGDSHAEHLFLGMAEALPDVSVVDYIQGVLPIRGTPEMTRILDHVVADPHIRVVVIAARWSDRGVPFYPLVDTLQSLRAAGKDVVVTDDVPDFPFMAFRCAHKTTLGLPPECATDGARFWATEARILPMLREVVAAAPGTRLVETTRALCNDHGCDMRGDGRLLYRDDHHLNMNGSRWVATWLVAHAPELAALGR